MSVRAEPVNSQSDTGRQKTSSLGVQATYTAWFAHCRGWLAIATLAPAGVIAGFSPLHYRPDTWGHFLLESAGWLLFTAGAALRWWSTLHVGGKKSRELISDGPYSITRNPIYLGTCLLTLSVAVLAQSLVFLVMVLLVATAYMGLTVLDEEQTLLAIHGEHFREYCQRVPRFFPNFRLLRLPKTIDVHVQGLTAELTRACRWVWIPLLCDLSTHLRCESWWPIWFPFL
jgi:protein-S-isoprenylcysteine O-methyltransferase Ste14